MAAVHRARSERKPSTVRDYRSILEGRLLPVFGPMPIEEITPAVVERWRLSLEGLSNRTKNKLLIVLHGIFRRAQSVYGVPVNPLARIEKHPQHSSGDIEVFSPEQVWALVRAAGSDQDGALFLTAALRMGELLALRWRDVDFAGATVRVRCARASRSARRSVRASRSSWQPTARGALRTPTVGGPGRRTDC